MAMCEGILASGKPCSNEIPEGQRYCRWCKGNMTKKRRNERKRAKEEKRQIDQSGQPAFDPEDMVECGAKTSCKNTMRHGGFRDPAGAKALNPKVIGKLAREASGPAKKVAAMFQKRLNAEPPFAVCGDCKVDLQKLWGNPEDFLYLDLAYAEERYSERMEAERRAEEERKRREAEEAEARQKAEAEEAEARRRAEEKERRRAAELEEQRRAAEEAEKRNRESIADDFLEGFNLEDEEDTTETDSKDKSELDDKKEELTPSDEWLLRIGLGQGNSTEFPFRPLHLLENNETVSCDNPHCDCHGTILDNSRDEGGNLILRHNSKEAIALLWASFIRTNAHHTRGEFKGQPIIGRDNEIADAKSLVIHCNKCGRRMRHLSFTSLLEKYQEEGMSYDDAKRQANIKAPSASQLRDLVSRSLQKKREQEERDGSNGSSDGTRSCPRQPHGRERQDTPRHGVASATEVGEQLQKLSKEASGAVSVKLDLSHLGNNGS